MCRPANGYDPAIWFPPPPPSEYTTREEGRAAADRRRKHEDHAKALCRTCPVRLECLEYADDNRLQEGIWGGLTPTERGQTPLR